MEKSKSKGKGEMRGFLHCALDGETVQRFGRDDVCWGREKQPTAKTEADLYGTTNKGTTARAKTKATAKARAGRGRGYIPTHRDGWGTRAFVVGRTDRFAIAHLNDDKAVVKMGHPGYGLGKMVRGF
jgi:hypothetical protein